MVFRVVVTDVFEIELPIESHEPASEAKKEFCERRVYVKVVFPRNIVGGEFSKVNFVKARMGDSRLGANVERMQAVRTLLDLGG
jgi:hypothetical protein